MSDYIQEKLWDKIYDSPRIIHLALVMLCSLLWLDLNDLISYRSMGQCKKHVTPVGWQSSYVFLTLTHRHALTVPTSEK